MFKYTFQITLGRLIARRTRFELEKYCVREGLELSIQESKGWFEIDYQMTVRGPTQRWPKVEKTLREWFKQLEEAN